MLQYLIIHCTKIYQIFKYWLRLLRRIQQFIILFYSQMVLIKVKSISYSPVLLLNSFM